MKKAIAEEAGGGEHERLPADVAVEDELSPPFRSGVEEALERVEGGRLQ